MFTELSLSLEILRKPMYEAFESYLLPTAKGNGQHLSMSDRMLASSPTG